MKLVKRKEAIVPLGIIHSFGLLEIGIAFVYLTRKNEDHSLDTVRYFLVLWMLYLPITWMIKSSLLFHHAGFEIKRGWNAIREDELKLRNRAVPIFIGLYSVHMLYSLVLAYYLWVYLAWWCVVLPSVKLWTILYAYKKIFE